ncbi:hypothetical protein [Polynucleobacter sp. UK-Gri1-W3]|uniref:hypothetical protein n=1 Tax=Polynucleobacter sp. UK-Gri1-W3 TaxID=1819737 RepID=UPI001C0CB5CE|nr:hypothetical protein [Polynucleobacter sp. UK-Gri1-W3]MBU3538667.1 hypothetical protein [Polynucleobacter sp. UK-Gri1-W3]
MQNLLYALIQSVHNLLAVLIVGVGAYGLFFALNPTKRALATVQSFAWALQGVTGGAFGFTTYHYFHQLPDIHGVAITALMIKIACVVPGFSFAATYVLFGPQFSKVIDRIFWWPMFLFGVLALSSAAFLRWFS